MKIVYSRALVVELGPEAAKLQMSGFESGKGMQVHLNVDRIGFCLLSPSQSNHHLQSATSRLKLV